MKVQSAISSALPRQQSYPIETLRVLAILLVVAYHVIGSSPSTGLHISAPHFARFSADFTIDIHMPIFAFISGYVYALKPLLPANLPEFISRKFFRLVIPGSIAITAFAVASQFTSNSLPSGDNWLHYYIMPYAHFWFLQAILVIFVVYCSFDIITGGRWLLISLVISSVWYLFGARFETELMSVNQAMYLLPYFIFGIVFSRFPMAVTQKSNLILTIALSVFVAALFANVYLVETTGMFSLQKFDAQSLATGLSISVLGLLLMSEIKLLDRLSPAIFTIYLYHVFGTSFTRRFLDVAGVDQFGIHLLLGVLGGVIFPLLIYQAALRHSWTQKLILGQTK